MGAVVVAAMPGAPDFPLSERDHVKVAEAEVNVARSSRKVFRYEVKQFETRAKYFDNQRRLAEVNKGMSQERLSKAAGYVKAKQAQLHHLQTVASAETAGQGAALTRTSPPSSPPPEEQDTIDLTADEGEEDEAAEDAREAA